MAIFRSRNLASLKAFVANEGLDPRECPPYMFQALRHIMEPH